MCSSWIKIALVVLSMGGNLLVYAEAPATTESVTQSEAAAKPDQKQNGSLIESAYVAKDYVDAIDRGEYAQSWTRSDPIFQKTLNQDEWKKYLENVREKIGKVVSRKISDQRTAWNPKGLPEGAYMIVIYDTSFQNLPNVQELITLRQGSDEKWRVLTYEMKK